MEGVEVGRERFEYSDSMDVLNVIDVIGNMLEKAGSPLRIKTGDGGDGYEEIILIKT